MNIEQMLQWGHVLIDVETEIIGAHFATKVEKTLLQWGHVLIDVETRSPTPT